MALLGAGNYKGYPSMINAKKQKTANLHTTMSNYNYLCHIYPSGKITILSLKAL